MLSVFDTIFVISATVSFSLPILSHSWNVNINKVSVSHIHAVLREWFNQKNSAKKGPQNVQKSLSWKHSPPFMDQSSLFGDVFELKDSLSALQCQWSVLYCTTQLTSTNSRLNQLNFIKLKLWQQIQYFAGKRWRISSNNYIAGHSSSLFVSLALAGPADFSQRIYMGHGLPCNRKIHL